jgi:hypothetical protein
MTFILVILGSILGAAAGYIGVSAAAYIIAGSMGMSDFEGGRAMFAAFFAGPIGAIAGYLLGVWLMLWLRGRRGIGAFAGYAVMSAATTVALAGIAAIAVYWWPTTIYRDGTELMLEFEIRLPTHVTPRLGSVGVTLQTDKNTFNADLDPTGTRSEGDRIVLTGEVELYFRTSSRLLVLKTTGEPDRIFRLPLAASPRLTDMFSPWARVDFIGDASEKPRKASADATDDFEIRYRLPDPHRPLPHIEFEVRLPAGTKLPDDFHVMHTAQRRDDRDDDWGYFLHNDWKRYDGDRPVLLGGMTIRKPDKHPKLTLKLLEGPLLVFDLDFPPQATPTEDFGPWKPVAALETYGQSPRLPGPDDAFELRYRIDPPRPAGQ